MTSPAYLPNYGLDLPEYGPETPVAITKADLKAAVASGELAFLRGCHTISSLDTLKETLAVADEQLEQVARHCGARVVRHEWGIYRPEDTGAAMPKTGDGRLLPKGTFLVADVDVIHGRRPSLPRRVSLNRRIQAYNNDAIFSGTPAILGDMFGGQFLEGINPAGEHARWIVDIEPRLAHTIVISPWFR